MLGINNTSHLRAQNLQDLIYKRGQAGVTKASVTITFDNSDKAKSPIGFEQYPKISVTRQILLGGTSKYLINGHRAQQVQVLNLFQSVQLNINHPNFLIMQGKITKMLNMKPLEILGLIEEAAGTKVYEWQREKAEKTMKKKNLKLQTTENLLSEEVEPKLHHLREQKRIVLEYQDIQSEFETLSKAVAAHDYRVYSESLIKITQKLEKLKNQLEQDKQHANGLRSEIKNLEEDFEQTKLKKQQEAEKSDVVKDIEKQENSITNEVTRLTTTKGIQQQTLVDFQQNLQKNQKELEKLENDVANKQTSYETFETKFNNFKEKLQEKKDTLQRKEDLLSSLSTGISSKGSVGGGYMSRLEAVNQQISECKVKINKDKMQISHLQAEYEESNKRVAEKQADLSETKKEIESKERNVEVLQQKMQDIGFDMEKYQQLKNERINLKRQLQDAEQQLYNFKQHDARFYFSYDRPSANFDDAAVKGFAGELFQLPQQNSRDATALDVCAGRKLFNIVVENENVGAQLLERGRLKRRVTIIPLTKIRANVVGNSKVELAKKLGPNKVDLALNLINFDNDSRKAMEYIFGNRFVCDDPATAKNVTFNRSIHVGSVTLEGDFYDPAGRLSGGSRRSNASTIMKFMQFKSLKQRYQSLKERMNNLESELMNQSEMSNKTEPLQHDLQVEQYQIANLKKKLENGDSASFIRHTEEIGASIQALEKNINELTKTIDTHTKEVAEIKQDMKEFNSDGAKKLRELKASIEKMRKELAKETKMLDDQQQQYQDSKVSNEQLKTDIETLNVEHTKIEGQIESTKKSIEALDHEIGEQRVTLAEKREQISAAKSRIAGITEELNEMMNVLKKKRSELNESDLVQSKDQQTLDQISGKRSQIQAYLSQITEAHEWVEDQKILESVLEQYPNINLQECHERIKQLESRIAVMKKKGINTNIMTQIEQHEKHEGSLKSKIKQINRDKRKIEETITKLDDYKRTELIKTYQKVSQDFGEIFAVLLPHSFAKLTPMNPTDVTKGLEVKVQLGNVWKESLVELSGGQRSLAALSLIMALLQFKPAPLYILDEVDAALDLNHTQAIGHLIKTRFKGSQFIVVSLKEGMFTNANRLFRVRFQEGTSVVTIAK